MAEGRFEEDVREGYEERKSRMSRGRDESEVLEARERVDEGAGEEREAKELRGAICEKS